MSEKIDPYHKWLGIPPEEQPPHHYRLLGIGLFEEDADVIEGAADRQMAHVQTYKTGPHSALSQKVLNELAAAKVCLLNAKKRAQYDAQLRAKLPPARQAGTAVQAAPLPTAVAIDIAPAFSVTVPAVDLVASKQGTKSFEKARARRRTQQIQLAAGGLLLAAVVIAMAIYLVGDRSTKTAGGPGNPSTQPESPVENPKGQPTPGPTKVASTTPTNGDRPGPAPSTATRPAPANTQSKPPKVGGKTPRPTTGGDPTTVAPLPPITNPPDKTTQPPVKPKTPAAEETDDPSPATPEAKKQPPPGDEELAVARQEVETAFGEELAAAKTAAAKAAVASTLFEQGIDAANEPASRFVLLEQARDLAGAGGDADLALRAVDEMAKQFLVDALQLKLDAALAASKVTRPAEERKAFAEALLTLVDEAIDAERFDEAGRLAVLAKSEAARADDAALREQADAQDKLVERLAKTLDSIRAAEEILEVNPDDPEAHLTLGKHYCLVRDDWEVGLEHLLKGSDADLKTLAEQELAEPEDAEAQAKLGDGWWESAARQAGADKAALKARARHWYEQALPGLPPLKKKTVEERLEGEGSSIAQAPKKSSSLLMQRAKKAISDQRLIQTRAIGQASGDAFAGLPEDGGLLVGFKVSLRRRGNTHSISSVQPLFLTPEGDVETGQVYGRSTNEVVELRAREGYAVGAIAVRGTTRVDGLGVVFMKLGGTSLNKRDTYNGDWQGAPGGGQPLGEPGKPVVGVSGFLTNPGGELAALGLIHLR